MGGFVGFFCLFFFLLFPKLQESLGSWQAIGRSVVACIKPTAAMAAPHYGEGFCAWR